MIANVCVAMMGVMYEGFLNFIGVRYPQIIQSSWMTVTWGSHISELCTVSTHKANHSTHQVWEVSTHQNLGRLRGAWQTQISDVYRGKY
jgi:hypothetical protein